MLKNNVYSSADFKVAQKRNRLIIVGIKKDEKHLNLNEIYNSINQQKNDVKLTVKDVLYNLPKLKPLKESLKENGKNISHVYHDGKSVKQHEPRFHNIRDVKIFKEWLKNNMNKTPLRAWMIMLLEFPKVL